MASGTRSTQLRRSFNNADFLQCWGREVFLHLRQRITGLVDLPVLLAIELVFTRRGCAAWGWMPTSTPRAGCAAALASA